MSSGSGTEPLKRLCTSGPETGGPVGKFAHAVIYADSQFFAANRALSLQSDRLFRIEAHIAVPAPVQMILALFRGKFDRGLKALARVQRMPQGGIIRNLGKDIGLTPEFCRRMRIGIGDESVFVRRGNASVHGRIRWSRRRDTWCT